MMDIIFIYNTGNAKTNVPFKVRNCAVPPDLRSETWFSCTWNLPKRWKSRKTKSYL